ncbi:hypothetical protein F5B20DRAFT_347593 [Whalleya microplaca]|nr:hypothetical protein F5B20DRAFT_347593 [Whalleya microplaca]
MNPIAAIPASAPSCALLVPLQFSAILDVYADHPCIPVAGSGRVCNAMQRLHSQYPISGRVSESDCRWWLQYLPGQLGQVSIVLVLASASFCGFSTLLVMVKLSRSASVCTVSSSASILSQIWNTLAHSGFLYPPASC